ncbi:MAG: hypothetical protein Q8Q09_09660 [Deltaproteobacteria bacterium]|nr:hypothetical protein [Deltaproteobacteria bacterium]
MKLPKTWVDRSLFSFIDPTAAAELAPGMPFHSALAIIKAAPGISSATAAAQSLFSQPVQLGESPSTLTIAGSPAILRSIVLKSGPTLQFEQLQCVFVVANDGFLATLTTIHPLSSAMRELFRSVLTSIQLPSKATTGSEQTR